MISEWVAKPLLLLAFTQLLSPATPLSAQTPTAAEILERSIDYHDPERLWGRFKGTLTVVAEYPERQPRVSTIAMDQPGDTFRIIMVQDGVEKALSLQQGVCSLSFQGSETFSAAIAEKERLTCERAQMWRDYYSYLYGLPMKLQDPGTILSPVVQEVDFHGKRALVLEVRYDPETGSDLWYFYLDPETYALQAYQFYHDKAANDGEYILLEGEIQAGTIRIPQNRSWFTNREGRFLGKDLLRKATLMDE
ncbi:DUF6503 family protein [Robiginitalea sediminis]|uniref:DUF6503 family protein n=1 Tax=Robiginitalea sediminis TaxID=1982593 RepID=UPI00117B2420|nr:DUF6503 family protein [Robiginitalea sediminis]